MAAALTGARPCPGCVGQVTTPEPPCCAGKAEPAVHGDGGEGGSGKPDLAHTLAGQCCPRVSRSPLLVTEPLAWSKRLCRW